MNSLSAGILIPKRGVMMSYVNPELREQFESLPIELKNEILNRDVRLENLSDLTRVLEQIAENP